MVRRWLSSCRWGRLAGRRGRRSGWFELGETGVEWCMGLYECVVYCIITSQHMEGVLRVTLGWRGADRRGLCSRALE
jgi:hypothetical protein